MAAFAAVIVVGLTVKLELPEDSVRLPVRFVPVTVNVLEALLPLTTVPNANAVVLPVLMVGTTQVPETGIVIFTPPPLMVIVPECEPATVGL